MNLFWQHYLEDKKPTFLAFFSRISLCCHFGIFSRQIAAEIKEKLANQEEVLREGISLTFLPCYVAIDSQLRNLRTAIENYFRFH